MNDLKRHLCVFRPRASRPSGQKKEWELGTNTKSPGSHHDDPRATRRRQGTVSCDPHKATMIVEIKWRWLVILAGIIGIGAVLLNLEEIVRLRVPETAVVGDTVGLDLPGYTGWARPASTLAGQFRIVDVPKKGGRIHEDFTVSIACVSCDGHIPWFFVRAYGPAILTGVAEPVSTTLDNKHLFQVTIHPVLPGTYKLELVVTYSYPIDPEWFPVKTLPQPYYEGYSVNGFPMMISIDGSKRSQIKPYCGAEDLLLGDRSYDDDLWQDASWRIIDNNVHKHDTSLAGRTNITLRGYQSSQNSIGFHAKYEYSHCKLRGVNLCDKHMHVIMIGDSVMRLQKGHLQSLFPYLKISFMELFGGILRCSRQTGPNVTDFLIPKDTNEKTVVLFNSGMHDIHRLCGHHFADERPEYLRQSELEQPCTEVYQTAIRSLAKIIQAIPATLRIFQTTTAAWPKYGNYGVAWDPRYAQELPLDSKFAERFNAIAVQQIQKLSRPSIEIIDAYWITLSRPDNRETNKNADIGKKLSHPGKEVITYMVMMWWNVVMNLVCLQRRE